MQLVELMNKAKGIAGSDYKLAQLLEVKPSKVSDWRHGRQPCPIEDQALIASIAGEDPIEQIKDAMLEKHAETKKGERLRAALKWRKL